MIKHYFIGNSHAVLACIKNMVLLKILFINWHTEDISRLSSRLSSRRKRVAYAVFSDLIAVLLLFLLFCFTSNLHLDQTRCKISLHIFIIFIWCSITSQVDKKRIAIFWRQNFSEIISSKFIYIKNKFFQGIYVLQIWKSKKNANLYILYITSNFPIFEF